MEQRRFLPGHPGSDQGGRRGRLRPSVVGAWRQDGTMDFLTDLHTNQARKGCVRPAPEPIAGIREESAEDGARTARIALREMEAALEGLREEHGQVVVMVALAGMSYQDCAKMLGVPTETVMSRLVHGRECLRQMLRARRSRASRCCGA